MILGPELYKQIVERHAKNDPDLVIWGTRAATVALFIMVTGVILTIVIALQINTQGSRPIPAIPVATVQSR